jgi:hypothetical protein
MTSSMWDGQYRLITRVHGPVVYDALIGVDQLPCFRSRQIAATGPRSVLGA